MALDIAKAEKELADLDAQKNQTKAMMRLLVDSGDMTPMAVRQLSKVLFPEEFDDSDV